MSTEQQVIALDLDAIDFDKGGGLVPVIAQDFQSAAVLMLGFADRAALAASIETRELTFFSRTKGRLWKKGETSGNVLDVVALTLDCDRDTVLATVRPRGPTCHTGASSCFGIQASADPIRALEAVVHQRNTSPIQREGSYTRKLLDDRNLRLKKLGEEAVELAVAIAEGADRERIAEEGADLLYHLVVALEGAGVSLDDVRRVLAARGT